MDKSLFHSAQAGYPVVTVNKRLARYLSQQYDLRQREIGLQVWPRPLIVPLSAWLQELWRQSGSSYDVLTDAQEQHVWETLIAVDLDPLRQQLMQIPATARKARDAHRLLCQYDADFSNTEAAEDHRVFLGWRGKWLSKLDKAQLLDRAKLPKRICEAFRHDVLPVPDRLVLAGFDELTPDLSGLCQALSQKGCDVIEWHPPPCADVQRVVMACADESQEVSTCARWVRSRLLNGDRNIGVVSPNLTAYRPLISSIFAAELNPESLVNLDLDQPEPYTISLGTALANEGLVRAALRLLSISQVNHFDDISVLLRSVYIAGYREEKSARALCEMRLRETGATTWTLQQLKRRLSAEPGVEKMVLVVEHLARYSSRNRAMLPGEWAHVFTNLLESCGWPGDESLDSREYQALCHFKETLLSLSSLDKVAKPLTRTMAAGILARLANEMVFQPESPETPVQVLGHLEAAGMSFDALWVLGMHDRAMPALPNPNPFIPLTLQRRLAMPHADADRERHFAGQLSARLFAAAPLVVASYPQMVDHADCRPSPLLSSFQEFRLDLVGSVDPRTIINDAGPVLETRLDIRADPLQTRKPFSGGTGLIKDQALCPFRAFAHYRLRAKGLETPEVGIDRMSRGTLVHKMLELFWSRIGSQDELLALTDENRSRLLTDCAEQALRSLEKSRRLDVAPVLRSQEIERLVRQGREWLEVEMQRPPFAILELEALHVEQVGQLQIRTKVDRIDRLPDHSLVIIDYKTGLPDPNKWIGERVTEPQLPIYCLSRPNRDVAAVTFAFLRPGDCRFRGLARNPDCLPGLSARSQEKLLGEAGMSSYDEVLYHWEAALPVIGDSFAGGQAAVDPVDADQACRYCDLTALCRIHERQILLQQEGQS